jgi:hypothetical protein
MRTLLSFIIVFGALIAVATVFNAWRKSRRKRGSALPDGEAVARMVEDVAVRLYVNVTIPGGPRAPGGRDRAQLVLSDQRLILATGHGRVLEIDAERPGSVRCTGPRRLVVEGQHPTGRAEVRAELAVDDAEGWQAAASALSGVSVGKLPKAKARG